MWELDHKEGWAQNLIVVLEKTLETPLDSKKIKLVNPNGNQSWIWTGSTDAEAPVLWSPAVKSWLIGKDLAAGKVWRQEEKRTTEDEMVDGITDSVEMSLSILWELVMSREARHAAVHESRRVWHNWATKLNWVNVMVFIGPVLVVVVTLRREIKSLPLRLSAADPVLCQTW